jgi:hypothetical protein
MKISIHITDITRLGSRCGRTPGCRRDAGLTAMRRRSIAAGEISSCRERP